jgi:hypothetical protein
MTRQEFKGWTIVVGGIVGVWIFAGLVTGKLTDPDFWSPQSSCVPGTPERR